MIEIGGRERNIDKIILLVNHSKTIAGELENDSENLKVTLKSEEAKF